MNASRLKARRRASSGIVRSHPVSAIWVRWARIASHFRSNQGAMSRKVLMCSSMVPLSGSASASAAGISPASAAARRRCRVLSRGQVTQ